MNIGTFKLLMFQELALAIYSFPEKYPFSTRFSYFSANNRAKQLLIISFSICGYLFLFLNLNTCALICCCCLITVMSNLCDPMDCMQPSRSSVHGILQTGTLEWVVSPSPEDLPDPGIKPMSPAPAGGFFTTDPPGKPYIRQYFIYFILLF